MMLEMAELYETNAEIQNAQNEIYEEGTARFLCQALRAFYQ